MFFDDNPRFDYNKEPARDILCCDCKSFYASTECAERGLDPLTTKLVVMSYPANDDGTRGRGLTLAASPIFYFFLLFRLVKNIIPPKKIAIA